MSMIDRMRVAAVRWMEKNNMKFEEGQWVSKDTPNNDDAFNDDNGLLYWDDGCDREILSYTELKQKLLAIRTQFTGYGDISGSKVDGRKAIFKLVQYVKE